MIRPSIRIRDPAAPLTTKDPIPTATWRSDRRQPRIIKSSTPPPNPPKLDEFLPRQDVPDPTPQANDESKKNSEDQVEHEVKAPVVKPSTERRTGPILYPTRVSAVALGKHDQEAKAELGPPSSKRRKDKLGRAIPMQTARKEEPMRKVPKQPVGVDLIPIWEESNGHYIVKETEIIDGPEHQYRIEGRLGEGTFGRVVRCTALSASPEKNVVAIKIGRSGPRWREASVDEYKILRQIMKADPLSVSHCIHAEDFFDFRHHYCIVFPVLGISLDDFLKNNKQRPFMRDHVWSFASQLLESVTFLHGLGVIHTDLKPANILLVRDATRTLCGRIKGRHVSKEIKILETTKIKVIDFGSAVFQKEVHARVITTLQYRAPEVILDMGWSFPSDVYSLGCIFMELHTGRRLLPCAELFESVAIMKAVLGPMPDAFDTWARANKPGIFQVNNDIDSKQLEQHVQKMKPLAALIALKDDSSRAFLQLVRRMLDYDPKSRVEAKDALASEYIRLGAPVHWLECCLS